MSGEDIRELDRMLRVTQLFRSSELAIARDRHGSEAARMDPGDRKLDAFTLGFLDGLARLAGNFEATLHLLLYMFALAETGSAAALRAAESMLELADQQDLRRFVDTGRQALIDSIARGTGHHGQYADLLVEERYRA